MGSITEWPIPKRRSTWVAAFFLSIVCFGIYYCSLYSIIKHHNYLQEKQASIMVEEDCGFGPPYGELLIKFAYPKYVPEYFDKEIIIEIHNKGSEVFSDENFSLQVSIPVIEKGAESFNKILSVDYMEHSVTIKPNEVKKELVSAKIIEVPSTETAESLSSLKIGGNICLIKKISQIEYSTFEPLVNSVIEMILLPPTSNQLIPLLVIFLCYLFDTQKREEAETIMQSFENFFVTLIGACGGILIISGLIIVSIWKLSNIWPIVLILAGIGLIIMNFKKKGYLKDILCP